MLNGDGNENCKKIDSLISNKKQLCKCSTLFCTFLCLSFARPQRETFQLHILWGKKCRMCSPKILFSLCSCSLFFHCRSFLPCWLLLADRQHFSFYHGRYKLSCSFSNKIRLLCFLSLGLALSLLSMSVQTLKLSRRKTRLCCCFFSLNVRVATQFRAKPSSSIWVATPVD